MRKAVKKCGKIVKAFRLGDESDMLNELIASGKIAVSSPGQYEVFSQEAVNGKGQQAKDGDYIKLDSTGAPYPNSASYFEQNHRKIGENEYEQIPVPVDIWTCGDPMCGEVEYLLKNGRLKLNEQDEQRYFHAFLWGSSLSAAKDAVIVFYDIVRDEQGHPTGIDFNFVERNEFEKTYDLIRQGERRA